MAGNGRLDQLVAMGPKTGRRLPLVGLHVPALADNIGREDGGEPALNALLGHEAVPSQLRLRKTLSLWVG